MQAYLSIVDPARCQILRLKNNLLWRDVGIVTVEDRSSSPGAAALRAFIRKRWIDKKSFAAIG
jgi:hypothetical protein